MLAALISAVAAGCGVATNIDVTVRPDGSGTVGVTVTLDRAAQTQVGDLASQLQTSDLAQAGWTVTGPTAGGDGTVVVRATKDFATPAGAGADVAALAGSGPAPTRPFRLMVTRRHSLWRTSLAVAGTVDLTCGPGCFGDAGLAKRLGSAVGVDPGSLSSASGQTAAQVLTFSVTVRLPGQVRATAPGLVNGHDVTWKPVLGQAVALSASSQSVNTVAVTGAFVGAAVVAVLLLLGVILIFRRRRRARKTR